MFSIVTTRPDLAYSVCFLSRFMSNLGKPHWAGLKWLLRYIDGTLRVGLVFKGSDLLTLKGYVDFDFVEIKTKGSLLPHISIHLEIIVSLGSLNFNLLSRYPAKRLNMCQ